MSPRREKRPARRGRFGAAGIAATLAAMVWGAAVGFFTALGCLGDEYAPPGTFDDWLCNHGGDRSWLVLAVSTLLPAAPMLWAAAASRRRGEPGLLIAALLASGLVTFWLPGIAERLWGG